jgi:hypothetical protein
MQRRQPLGFGRSAVAIASAGLVALGAGCAKAANGDLAHGGPTTTGNGSSGSPAVRGQGDPDLAFSSCMRSHGVPNFPDPTNSNELPSGMPKVGLQELGVSTSQFQAAEQRCRSVLPDGGRASPAAGQQQQNAMLKFSQCMRTHGVPSWPDPTPVAQQLPGEPAYAFGLQGIPGLDTHSWSGLVHSAIGQCGHLMPPGLGGVPVERS